MISSFGQRFASSQRTIADLSLLARQSPDEARTYLKGVKTRLGTDDVSASQTIDELLTATGDLSERIAASAVRLGTVFASAADQWGAVQTSRAQTIGWSTSEQRATAITGKVGFENGEFFVDAPGLRRLTLAEGSADNSLDGIPGQWMLGFMNDGPLRLTGTLGADGSSFNVESFALDRDGTYDTFTAARVMIDETGLWLRTTMANRVEVTDPHLLEQFRGMHRLAVILPGEPKLIGGKLTYDASPQTFFALGRFSTTAVQGNVASLDMAHEALVHAPVRVPADQLGRVNHTWRVWLEGSLTPGAAGEKPTGFTASYVSEKADTFSLTSWESHPLKPKVAAAAAEDAARELSSPG